jgi:hypothetical protein
VAHPAWGFEMNERIKELARDAGLLVHNPEGVPTKLEKFAELIVKECADIINHRADTCSDWLDSVKANEAVREGQRECAKTIKEHFGVEE